MILSSLFVNVGAGLDELAKTHPTIDVRDICWVKKTSNTGCRGWTDGIQIRIVQRFASSAAPDQVEGINRYFGCHESIYRWHY